MRLFLIIKHFAGKIISGKVLFIKQSFKKNIKL